uniref:Uncharacterized protein n=1 Tax=Romanomermis culicivorax TaxID=13658 RepID=A0A915KDS6_ROMCU
MYSTSSLTPTATLTDRSQCNETEISPRYPRPTVPGRKQYGSDKKVGRDDHDRQRNRHVDYAVVVRIFDYFVDIVGRRLGWIGSMQQSDENKRAV